MSFATWAMIVSVALFTTTAAVCDFRSKKIPNWLTVPSFLAALCYHAVVGFLETGWGGLGFGLLTALEGFGVGFGILLVLWLIGGGGAGDVKLMGAVGAWLGPKSTLLVFLVSCVFIIVLSIAALAYQLISLGMSKTKRRFLSQGGDSLRDHGLSKEEAAMRRKTRRRLLPFGVPVALATWIVLAWSLREQIFHH